MRPEARPIEFTNGNVHFLHVFIYILFLMYFVLFVYTHI